MYICVYTTCVCILTLDSDASKELSTMPRNIGAPQGRGVSFFTSNPRKCGRPNGGRSHDRFGRGEGVVDRGAQRHDPRHDPLRVCECVSV